MKAVLMLIPAPLWLIFSAIFFPCGEYLSKRWAVNPSAFSTLIVVLSYATSTLLWLPALFHKNELAVMGTAWLLLATVATVLIGTTVFGEVITARQTAGAVLSAIALILLCA
jgi:drug/metabolite transporter (DMT)-like permease